MYYAGVVAKDSLQTNKHIPCVRMLHTENLSSGLAVKADTC